MGNIASNSFKKDMSDDDFTKALVKICEDRFGDVIRVRRDVYDGEAVNWIVGPVEELMGKDTWSYEWEIYRESKRKFGGKHAHSEFGWWMMAVIQNELAFRFKGRISDEGVSGTWAGEPHKESLKSFKNYLFHMQLAYMEPDDPAIMQRIERTLAKLPEVFRDL